MKKKIKVTMPKVMQQADLGVMCDLNACLLASDFDGYLQRELRGLMRCTSPSGQRRLVEVVSDYIYRLRRHRHGEEYIDQSLNWIFNRHECIKAVKHDGRMEVKVERKTSYIIIKYKKKG